MNLPLFGAYATTKLTVAGAASYVLATYEKTDPKLTAVVFFGSTVAQLALNYFFPVNSKEHKPAQKGEYTNAAFVCKQLKATCLNYSSYGFAAIATALLWKLNILPNLNLNVNGLRALGTGSYVVISSNIGHNLANRASNYLNSKTM